LLLYLRDHFRLRIAADDADVAGVDQRRFHLGDQRVEHAVDVLARVVAHREHGHCWTVLALPAFDERRRLQ
jgi:hypothetical protein